MGRFAPSGRAIARLSATAAALLGVLLALPSPARAQALSIAPVTLDIGRGQRATSLTITNDGPVETVVQIRPFNWGQDLQDTLTPAGDVIVSPPIARIRAHGSQVVRILVRHSPGLSEISYRLLVDQIPPPATPGLVQLALRFSLPLFVEATTQAKATIHARIAGDARHPTLELTNSGNRHEKLMQIALQAPDDRAIPVDGGEQMYLLAGSLHSLALAGVSPASARAKSYRLTAQSIGGPIDIAVTKPEVR